jgi:glycyl-tRNA synthetase beta chain
MNINPEFLIEIGTEELPAKGLVELSKNFEAFLLEALKKNNIPHGESIRYVTPRRLAIWIKDLPEKQPDVPVERKGPAIDAPEKAREGFAKSYGVSLDQLNVQDNYLVHSYIQLGKTLTEYMPAFIEEALKKIPPGKTMRWGSHTESFIRPIRWILMLHGDKVVPATIFGLPASNVTYGHRFHHPEPIVIKNAAEYEEKLIAHKVITSFEKRKNKILEDASELAQTQNGQIRLELEDELLNEITGLVEWPVILLANFDARFLDVPREALFSAIQGHQKSIPIFGLDDNDTKLLPCFIVTSNVDSNNRKTVIQGNERVMRARLSDVDFFDKTDRERTLESRREDLKTITFQAKLGSLYEKSERIVTLSQILAAQINIDVTLTKEAARLSKADLTTNMVTEFPELQGIMGYHYAPKNTDDEKEIARALRTQYDPRPADSIGQVLGLADRLDTLVGIFGINQQPTGDKDPFGLRRAAVGILNILLDRKADLDLKPLLEKAVQNYGDKLPNKKIIPEVLKFILERLRAIYIAGGTNNTIILAVEARGFSNPVDFAERIRAVKHFSQLPQASALAAANKRVSNILIKEKQDNIHGEPDPELFEHPSEEALWDAILHKKNINGTDYKKILTELADLQSPIDQFFNDVMVMVDDEKLRLNRLRLLNYLRQLFLQVADISLLQE